jgi:hypothetical protein
MGAFHFALRELILLAKKRAPPLRIYIRRPL